MGIFKYSVIIFLVECIVDLTFANEVTKAFGCYGIVPDYVPIGPKCRVEVAYDTGVYAELGNKLTPTETKYSPEVNYEADRQKYYTLCVSDHDVPSPQNSTLGEFLHWLVVNIPSNDVRNGEALGEYIGPEPPAGTGYHRYVFLAYEQPKRICFDKEKLNYTVSDQRYKFSVSRFAEEYKLGNPIAGNFFLAEYDGSTYD